MSWLLVVSLAACGGEPSSTETEAGPAPKVEEPKPEPAPPPEPEVSPLELAQAKCKSEPACAEQGLCTAKPGAEADKFDCVAASVEDCRASATCKAEAACSLDEATGACAFGNGKDCYYADACLHDGRCYGSQKDGVVECTAGGKDPVVQHFSTIEHDGALDVDVFRRIVRAHSHKVKMCRIKGRADGANGLAKIGWTIDAEGQSTNVKIVANGLETEVFAQCLVDEISTWRFPKPADGKPIELVMGYSFAR